MFMLSWESGPVDAAVKTGSISIDTPSWITETFLAEWLIIIDNCQTHIHRITNKQSALSNQYLLIEDHIQQVNQHVNPDGRAAPYSNWPMLAVKAIEELIRDGGSCAHTTSNHWINGCHGNQLSPVPQLGWNLWWQWKIHHRYLNDC